MNQPFYYTAPIDRRRSKSSFKKSERNLFQTDEPLRKLNVLVDDKVFEGDKSNADEVLDFLLGSQSVSVWRFSTPFPHVDQQPDKPTTNHGEIAIFETTGSQGSFGFGGLAYWYCYLGEEGSGLQKAIGNVATDPANMAAWARGYEDVTTDQLERIKVVLALKEIAVAVNADIVITSMDVSEDMTASMIGNANIVTKAEALAPVAHYLRRQGKFIVGSEPYTEMDPDSYYEYAVYAYAPHLRHWIGKVERAIQYFGESHWLHSFYANTALTRCSRALRRYDDLIAVLGEPATKTSIDDAVDMMDHILVSLCAAVDSLARSLSEALNLNKRNAKLHDKDWVRKNVKPVYGNAPEFEKLSAQVSKMAFLFKIRNSIHSLGLMPYADSTNTDKRSELPRLRLLIPPTSSDAWKNLPQADLEYWGVQIDGVYAHADLFSLAQKALNEVFSFIDVFCEIISFEPVSDKSDVLQENIIKVEDKIGLAASSFIALTGSLKSPLLDGSYDPDSKRVLETDAESDYFHRMEKLLSSIGWNPNPDFEPLREPPIFTQRYGQKY